MPDMPMEYPSRDCGYQIGAGTPFVDRMLGARLRLVGHNPHAAGVRPAPRERCPSTGATGDGLPEYARRAVLRLAALTNARHRRRQAPAAEPSQLASRGESRRRLLARTRGGGF